ncbi:hypothetical protein EYC84_003178 [Monilinia fructicola]|uniref:Uncharacterized protein n=1 Tax=Monilinia fructicola TaxID=38448 RepID=A0A5M9JXF8_MONFR|nr:hypothetical protein EYC84_003178 [Monilinia fructicola]
MEDRLPPVVEHVPGVEVVIIAIDWADAKESLREKLLSVFKRVHDICSDQKCSSRDDPHPAVKIVRGRKLEVVALNIDAGDEIANGLGQSVPGLPPDALAGPHDAYARVFEFCQDAAEEGGWPDDVVVGVGDEVGFHGKGCMDALSTLAWFADGYGFNCASWKLSHSHNVFDDSARLDEFFGSDGRNDDFGWIVVEGALDGLDELWAKISHAGYDYRDIAWQNGGI